MIIGVYPGSFDPLTKGHEDIIIRALSFCDKLEIALGVNSDKHTLFSEQERLEMIKSNFAHYANIKVSSFQGLLVNYAKQLNANLIIRGVRNSTDFEYENNLANINKFLVPNIETIFLNTKPELSMVSSSAVKEIARHGGDISKFVVSNIEEKVKNKFGFFKTGILESLAIARNYCITQCGKCSLCLKL